MRAFVGREESERRRDQRADLIKGARPRGAEERFQFGEGQLDRIEVGAVGRQEPEVRAGLSIAVADLGLLVDGEVVEHHDIPWPQRGDQHLFDVGEETRMSIGPSKTAGARRPSSPSAAMTVWVCQ